MALALALLANRTYQNCLLMLEKTANRLPSCQFHRPPAHDAQVMGEINSSNEVGAAGVLVASTAVTEMR